MARPLGLQRFRPGLDGHIWAVLEEADIELRMAQVIHPHVPRLDGWVSFPLLLPEVGPRRAHGT